MLPHVHTASEFDKGTHLEPQFVIFKRTLVELFVSHHAWAAIAFNLAFGVAMDVSGILHVDSCVVAYQVSIIRCRT